MVSKFISALEAFEGAVIWMSTMEHASMEPGDPPPEDRRKWCLKKFDLLRQTWNRPPNEFARLEELVGVCISAYQEERLDDGDYAVKDIQEIIWNIRTDKEKKR